MSEVKVNKISPRSGTTVTLGDSGDTITLASGVSLTGVNATFSGDLTVDTNTLYVNSTNNRVGIGTTSPSSTLEVIGSVKTSDGGTQGISVASTGFIEISRTNGDAFIDFKTSTSEDFDARIQQVSNGLRFETGGNGSTSERMRIDSSGNVLVGKTSANFSTEGVELDGTNKKIQVTRDGGVSLLANRLTSDGGILSICKDDSTIGTLGSFSSLPYFAGSSNGILIGSGNVVPSTQSGAIADNTIDLGASNRRFNDLYLGGNIYIGGTGSANALDDYEEGTWTPSTGGVESVGTLSSAIGEYTKIGNVVYIRMTFDVATNFVGSTITGLPFTVGGNSTVSSFYPASVMTDNSLNNQILPNFQITTTNVVFKEDDTNGNAHNPNTTNNIYRVCGFYFVN